MEQYTEAISAYTTSIEIKPTEIASHINIGNAYRELSYYHHAKDSYTNALNLLTSSSSSSSSSSWTTAAVLYNNLALLELKQHNYQQAKELLNKAQENLNSDTSKHGRRDLNIFGYHHYHTYGYHHTTIIIIVTIITTKGKGF
jgi:tetratricopeptide (TPR) repeat protein